jgi:hypothetical protein
VTTLLEQLAQSNPDITAEQAAEFRACVLTIAQHNETDPKCIEFSLQDWAQWLENGGYGRDNFVAMLKQVCNAALGDAAVAALWDYAQSIAIAPEGIPRLIEYVQTTYPGLEQRMTTLEALALEEEQRIQDTAGGMGKTAGIVTGVVSGVVVGGLMGWGVPKWRANRKAKARVNVQKEAADLKEQADRKAEEEYSEKTEKLQEMIRERGIAAEKNQELSRDQVEDMRRKFASRSKVFDFQAYGKAKFEAEVKLGIIGNVERKQADLLHEARLKELTYGDKILTDEERGLATLYTSSENKELEPFQIVNKRGFEKYTRDRYILSKAEELLRMSDGEFTAFFYAEGRGFRRGDMNWQLYDMDFFKDYDVLSSYDGSVWNKNMVDEYQMEEKEILRKNAKEDLDSVDSWVDEDIHIEVGRLNRGIRRWEEHVERDVESRVEETVVEETVSMESAIEAKEESFESDIM